MNMFKIVIYKQKTLKKEDKIFKKYDVLDTDEYIKNNKEIVIKKDVNTFEYTDKVLANTNITYIDTTLKELKCKLDDNDTIKINGFFELIIICLTDKGIYKNMYVVRKNKLGMLTYDKVNSQAIITKNGVIL